MARKTASEPSAGISADTRMLILHGTDRFLQDEKLEQLHAALEKTHGKDGVDTIRFDGQAGPRILADVLDECRSTGLMQQHKVVVIDNAEMVIKETEDEAPAPPKAAGRKRAPAPHSPREILENYAADPSPTATLILRAATWRPGNLDKAVAAIGAVYKCEPMSDAEAIAWAQKRARESHKTSIDAKAAGTLIATVGTELGRIDTELEKLALAAGGEGQPITAALVEQMTGQSREEEFWAIQDRLLEGNPGTTLAELRDLIEVSRHDPVAIGWAYMDAARRVHMAAAAVKQGTPLKSLARPLKIWGFGPEFDRKIALMEQAARSAGPARAARLFNAVVAADAANKSSLGEPMRNLEVLTVRFAGAIGKR
ncbi:MAG TPA: DNA polymerase III subunit delta [Phycisphaerales bacterium]|nr:DNA polymerase III subunit delta [Phycisphaerales bacterium]